MDGIVLSLTGVILQVLGLVAAFGSLAVGAASLAGYRQESVSVLGV